MTETALVSTLGNRMKDMDIPVRVPYTLKARSEFRPYCCRVKGIRMASALVRRFMQTRLPVTGTAVESMFFAS